MGSRAAVTPIAARVLFINEGRLVYDGPTSELLKDGRPLDEHFHELSPAAVA